jgi:hypothetical protein
LGRIFKGQSALRITLKTFCDLEGVASAVIRFRKPNKKTGEFTAAVSDASHPAGAAAGNIFYECSEGDIDVSGWWSFWAFVTFADGRTAAGQVSKVYVWKSGYG